MPDPITDKMPNGHLETEVIVEIELKINNNDNMRGRSRDRHDNRPMYNQDKAHYLMEEMNLGLDLTLE